MRLLVSSTPKILPSLLPEFAPWLGTLVTPNNGALAQALRMHEAHGLPWACDNAAFGAFDAARYRRMLAKLPGLPGCLWVAVPDVVGDAAATLARWAEWRDEVRQASGQPLAFVSQDGCDRLPLPWDDVDALFVGGTDEWKLTPRSALVCAEAIGRGKMVHVGRCNSWRRYRAARAMGARTVDGTDVCQWPDRYIPEHAAHCRVLDRQEADQPTLFGI